MSVDNSIVKKIANLSKINIDEVQEEVLKNELNNILNWVDELKKVDTNKTEPMLSVFNESMIMREDTVNTETSSRKVLENAPEKESGFFAVSYTHLRAHETR